MLPLSLLKTAQHHPTSVELKDGETYNGHLVSCDNWMHINLREVIRTSRDGDRFRRMPERRIRGSSIRYLRIPDEDIDMVKEEAGACSSRKAAAWRVLGEVCLAAVAEAGSQALAEVSQKRSPAGRRVNRELALRPPET